jgi:hypothetical protein
MPAALVFEQKIYALAYNNHTLNWRRVKTYLFMRPSTLRAWLRGMSIGA